MGDFVIWFSVFVAAVIFGKFILSALAWGLTVIITAISVIILAGAAVYFLFKLVARYFEGENR